REGKDPSLQGRRRGITMRAKRTSPAVLVSTAAVVAFFLQGVAVSQEKEPDKEPSATKEGGVAAAPPAIQGAEVLRLPGDARGDAPGALDDLLKAIKERPDDPGSVLAGEAVGNYWN